MATHKSAIKRHKQSLKLRTHNRNVRSTLRTSVKTLSEHLAKGDLVSAEKTLREVTRLFDKAAVHGVLHKKNAQRSISRVSKRVAAAKAAKA